MQTLFVTAVLFLTTPLIFATDSAYYLIPRAALQKPALSKNMVELLKAVETRRNKRQYYIYQQNPMEANVAITPVNYQVDPVIDNQYANSPQYILVQSRDLIPFQSQMMQDTANAATDSVLSLITPRADINNMISLAAQFAMQTKRGIESQTDVPITIKVSYISESPSTTTSTLPPTTSTLPSTLVPNMTTRAEFKSNFSSTTVASTSLKPTNISVDVSPRSVQDFLGMCDPQGVGGSTSARSVAIPAGGCADTSSGSGPAPCGHAGTGGGISDALKTIHDEIKKMKDGKYNGKKEGLPCPLIGTWTSQAAGVVFTIPKEDSQEMCIAVQPAKSKGFFETPNWEVMAQMPFNKISLIHMTAVHQDSLHMATFTGECRICEGKEFVTGHWLVVKNESTCSDMNKGQDFFGDLWERINCNKTK